MFPYLVSVTMFAVCGGCFLLIGRKVGGLEPKGL
jgi:hypothetical protein